MLGSGRLVVPNLRTPFTSPPRTEKILSIPVLAREGGRGFRYAMLLTNARIYTLDPTNTTVDSIVVRDGLIAFVGRREDINPQADEETSGDAFQSGDDSDDSQSHDESGQPDEDGCGAAAGSPLLGIAYLLLAARWRRRRLH